MSPPPKPRVVLTNLLVACCYVVLGKAALLVALPPGFATAIWPPAGLALAACLTWGRKGALPGIFAGAFITNATVGVGFHPTWHALTIGVGSTLQAAVGSVLLRRSDPKLEFIDARAIRMMMIAIAATCVVAASIGNAGLLATGQIGRAELRASLLTWWIGDAAGVLIFFPLAMSFCDPRPTWRGRRISLAIPIAGASLLFGTVYYFVQRLAAFFPTSIFEREASTLISIGILSPMHMVLYAAVVTCGGTTVLMLVLSGTLEGYRREIQTHKATLENLGQSERRFRALVEVSADLIWRADARGEPLGDNASWRTFTGQSPEELKAGGWASALHPEDRERASLPEPTGQDHPAPYAAERRVRRLDGVWRDMVSRTVPILGNDGQVEEWIGSYTDITERKLFEHRLMQSQKLEAIGKLTAGIAHDFNNLLALISTTAELLTLRSALDAEGKKFIGNILNAVDRGAELTKNLLAFGRRQALSPRLSDLCAQVSETATLIRRALPESIDVEVLIPPQPIMICVDWGQLTTALINLAFNARDAMSDGGFLLISVGTEERDTPKSADRPSSVVAKYAVLTVQDTGCGMARETLERAFDPFFTTKQVGKGTGLGLSMVYGFTQQSGGWAELFSSEGKGTTVKLLFPVAENEIGDIPELQIPAASFSAATRRKALLVEDVDDLRAALSRQLESLGFEVFTAADAKDALAILAEHDRIDLLVTDLGLPRGMNGEELAGHAASDHLGIKIITMSGYNETSEDGEAVAPFQRIHLRKPFRLAALAEAIESLFE